MSSRAVRRAAESLRGHSKRVVDTLGPQPAKYAVVRSVDPLVVELAEHRIQLTDDDLVLTQSARRYDLEHGIQAGDSVVVHPMGNGDWVLASVVSEKVTFAGPGTAAQPPAGRVFADYAYDPGTGDGDLSGSPTTIIKVVPYFDSDGDLVGYIPLIA